MYIADTTRALYVWEHPYYPFFYIPEDDFAPECKKRTTPQLVDESGQPGITRWSIEAGDKTTDRVICFCRGELKGYVRFEFEAAGMYQGVAIDKLQLIDFDIRSMVRRRHSNIRTSKRPFQEGRSCSVATAR